MGYASSAAVLAQGGHLDVLKFVVPYVNGWRALDTSTCEWAAEGGHLAVRGPHSLTRSRRQTLARSRINRPPIFSGRLVSNHSNAS